MDNFIFDKTDKGREEIITRQYRLAPRLRSLLVLIDGKKSTPELLQQVSGLGLDMQSLADLVDGEFIEGVGIVPESGKEQEPQRTARAEPSKPSEKTTTVATGLIAPDKFLALQKFFNETIKSSVGLRGFTLQLKAERASGLADFVALREPYLAAVQKAKGEEMMLSLRERLDQLLQEAEQSIAR
jgi:hypothetical protein